MQFVEEEAMYTTENGNAPYKTYYSLCINRLTTMLNIY